MPDADGSLTPAELRERDRLELCRQRTDRAFEQAMQIGILALIGALALLGWQVVHYARAGQWNAISVIDVLCLTGNSWARAPSDWIGIHHLLTALPASLAVAAAGVTTAWGWYRGNLWVLTR